MKGIIWLDYLACKWRPWRHSEILQGSGRSETGAKGILPDYASCQTKTYNFVHHIPWIETATLLSGHGSWKSKFTSNLPPHHQTLGNLLEAAPGRDPPSYTKRDHERHQLFDSPEGFDQRSTVCKSFRKHDSARIMSPATQLRRTIGNHPSHDFWSVFSFHWIARTRPKGPKSARFRFTKYRI